MRWKILRENEPDNFVETGEVWDDEYVGDWGDEESAKVTQYLNSLQLTDPESKSYAASVA